MNPFDANDERDSLDRWRLNDESTDDVERRLKAFRPRPFRATGGLSSPAQALEKTVGETSAARSTAPLQGAPIGWMVGSWACGAVMGALLMFSILPRAATDSPAIGKRSLEQPPLAAQLEPSRKEKPPIARESGDDSLAVGKPQDQVEEGWSVDASAGYWNQLLLDDRRSVGDVQLRADGRFAAASEPLPWTSAQFENQTDRWPSWSSRGEQAEVGPAPTTRLRLLRDLLRDDPTRVF